MSFFRSLFGRRAGPQDEAPPVAVAQPAPEDAKEPSTETAPADTPNTAAEAPQPSTPTSKASASEPPADVIPAPQRHLTISRPQPRADRVKSRLMNFGQLDAVLDEMEAADTPGDGSVTRPVGWLVIIEGPGTGGWYTLESGVASIGRGGDQTIRMNYGDDAISRSNHASVAYEPLEHRFRLGAGTSKNDVLLNGEVVQGSVALSHGDRITVGETTLRLAAFCDDRFSWAPIIDRGGRNVLSA